MRDKPISQSQPTPDNQASFGQWLEEMADPRAWADGIILMALSRRHGCPLLVWYESQGVWLRGCIAPAFSQWFVKLARSAVPLVLVLRSEHYQWLRPSQDIKLPKSWLAEGVLPEASVLRGGAPSTAGTPSLHACSGENTPSLVSLGDDSMGHPPVPG